MLQVIAVCAAGLTITIDCKDTLLLLISHVLTSNEGKRVSDSKSESNLHLLWY